MGTAVFIGAGGGNVNPQGTKGSIQYKKSDTELGGDADLLWDETYGTLIVKSKGGNVPAIELDDQEFFIGRSYVPLSSANDIITKEVSNHLRNLVLVNENGKVTLSKESIKKYFPELIMQVASPTKGFEEVVDVVSLMAYLTKGFDEVADVHLPSGNIVKFRSESPKILSTVRLSGDSNLIPKLVSFDLHGINYSNSEMGVLRCNIYAVSNYYSNGYQYNSDFFSINFYLIRKQGTYDVALGSYMTSYSTDGSGGRKQYTIQIHEGNKSGIVGTVTVEMSTASSTENYVSASTRHTVGPFLSYPIYDNISGVGEIEWQDIPLEDTESTTCKYHVLTTHHMWRPNKIIVMRNGIELKNGDEVDVETLHFARKVIIRDDIELDPTDKIWIRYEKYPPTEGYYTSMDSDTPVYDVSSELPEYE